MSGSFWVLNIDNSGKPVGLIPWYRAAGLIWCGKASPVEVVEGKYWRSPSVSIPQSRIIQTHEYIKVFPIKDSCVIKRVLFSRDRYTCQYCGKKLTRSTATVDHIKPRSSFLREGRPSTDANSYTNCVTACTKCNVKKGDRSSLECGMVPMSTPTIPTYIQVLWAGKVQCSIQADYIAAYFKIDKEIILAAPSKS